MGGTADRTGAYVIERIVVAVDDSPPGLAATRLALALAARVGARVRLVHVMADSYVTSALRESGGPGMAERRSAAFTRDLSRLSAAVQYQAAQYASGQRQHGSVDSEPRGSSHDRQVMGPGSRCLPSAQSAVPALLSSSGFQKQVYPVWHQSITNSSL